MATNDDDGLDDMKALLRLMYGPDVGTLLEHAQMKAASSTQGHQQVCPELCFDSLHHAYLQMQMQLLASRTGDLEGKEHLAAVELANTANADRGAGVLGQMPNSLLHEFIKNLPADSKLSLFQCSRWLARCVLEAAADVVLVLKSQHKLTAQQTEVRGIITQLLSVRKEFAIKLWPEQWQPFPTQLADRVISLSLHLEVHSDTVCCPWAAMTNLRMVSLEGEVLEEHCDALCEVVEAGQLQPPLLRLDVQEAGDPPVLDRLFRTLGSPLEEVVTAHECLLKRVGQFTALRRCSVHECCLTGDIMHQLCRHPTLQKLTLNSCDVEGDYSQCKCGWEELSVRDGCLDVLLCLPLASVQQIRLLDCFLGRHEGDAQAVNSLTQHLHKIVLNAEEGNAFEFERPCADLALLLRRMQGVEELVLDELKLEKPRVLSPYWQALPPCVTKICLYGGGKVKWQRIWQDLPTHVTELKLHNCVFKAADLCAMIRAAPAHVCKLVMELCLIKHGNCRAADLNAARPKHLKLVHDLFIA